MTQLRKKMIEWGAPQFFTTFDSDMQQGGCTQFVRQKN
jgi:hypothetical protein